MKRIVHVYKGSDQWRQSPPGIGDFVRGTCHLFERLEGTGVELRIDISQTGFTDLIEADPSFFQTGDPARIAAAEEFFLDAELVQRRLDDFLRSDEPEFYLCTNLGAWDRTTLNRRTREFMKKFYRFTEPVTRLTAEFAPAEYVALSVRCGDKFYGGNGEITDAAFSQRLFALIEREILPHRRNRPLVVMSDCYPLKRELVKKYGFISSPYAAQHGAFGNVTPVAVDLNVIKNSKFNYHINAWQSWWSGFSHYTSLVFAIPSMNFRTPLFIREEVTVEGKLHLPLKVRAQQKLRRWRSFVRSKFRRGVE